MTKDWRPSRLKFEATFQSGGTPDTEDLAMWAEPDDPSGTPWVAISDMSQRQIVDQSAKSVTDNALVAKRLSVGEPGTLLLAMYASVGEVARLTIRATWNQALLGISPHPDQLDTKFLEYTLRASRDLLLSDVRANTQSNLNASQVANLPLLLPPLEVQQVIADYLDRETAKIDALIEKQERLIATLRERRAAEVYCALGYSESSVPLKHLATVVLGKMLDTAKAAPPEAAEMPYVRAGNVEADGSLTTAELNVMPFTPTEVTKFEIRADDVMVIEGGATAGRPAYVAEDVPGVAFQKTLNRVRAIPDRATGRYLYYALSSVEQSGYYSAIDAAAMPHVTTEKLLGIAVPRIPVADQVLLTADLDRRLARLDDLVSRAQRFIELSRERRAALITAAVTGQIDVPVAA